VRLTDISIRSVKPPPRGQKTHFDDTLSGFGIRVSQGGTKTFVLMHGVDRRLSTIGRVGIITLAQARQKAKSILAAKTLGVHEPPRSSFGEAKTLFLASCESRLRDRTTSDYTRLLNRHFSRFTLRPLASIQSHEVGDLIDGLKRTPVEQNHAFAAARTLFRFCVRRGLITRSPMEGMTLPARVQTRERVLTDPELATVFKAAAKVGYPFGSIVQLLILTGQRKGEIALLEWGWIRDKTITIPASVAKNHREHTIPFSDLTVDVLAQIPSAGDRLFTVYNWDAKTDNLRDLAGIPHFTLHDLRRTYASGMASMGVAPHVVERLLNHVSGTVSGVAAIYNRYSYSVEMTQAVSAFERHLSVLLSRSPTGG
jgi:integrase